jgi:hypothetical protein
MNSTLIQLLLNLGTAGASLALPGIGPLITTAITAAEGLIADLTGGKTASQVAPQIFLTVLQAAFGVLEAEGKLTAEQATAFGAAITATLAADTAAQATVDPSTLAAPIPQIS